MAWLEVIDPWYPGRAEDDGRVFDERSVLELRATR